MTFYTTADILETVELDLGSIIGEGSNGKVRQHRMMGSAWGNTEHFTFALRRIFITTCAVLEFGNHSLTSARVCLVHDGPLMES